MTTGSVRVSVLSVGSGSPISESTVAVFASVVPVKAGSSVAVTRIVRVAPGSSVPSSQATSWPVMSQAAAGSASIPLSPAGSVSATCVSIAAEGPSLWTVSV